MSRIESILFICTGNLCRSPMAEGILKYLVESQGQVGVRVSSAGTWGLEGEEAAPHAVKVCAARGIDISGHVARRLTTGMIEESDLVVTMEMDHLQNVLDLVPEALSRTQMLGRYGSKNSRVDQEIRDPYGRPMQAYVQCFEQIEQHVRALFGEILRTWKAEEGRKR